MIAAILLVAIKTHYTWGSQGNGSEVRMEQHRLESFQDFKPVAIEERVIKYKDS